MNKLGNLGGGVFEVVSHGAGEHSADVSGSDHCTHPQVSGLTNRVLVRVQGGTHLGEGVYEVGVDGVLNDAGAQLVVVHLNAHLPARQRMFYPPQ